MEFSERQLATRRANAISQMTGPAANAIAPALAGLLYAVIGVPGAILIDIATFGVAIVVLLAVRIPMPTRTPEGAAMAFLMKGIHF